jgi:hypothetical protein
MLLKLISSLSFTFYSCVHYVMGMSIHVMHFFQDRVSPTICQGLLGTAILLISASQVAGITEVSHQHLASDCFCHDNFLTGRKTHITTLP